MAEHIVLTRSSILINSNNREEMIRKFPSTVSFQLGAQSMIITPLISKDEVIGALAVYSAKIDAYSEKDLLFIERAANQIAGANPCLTKRGIPVSQKHLSGIDGPCLVGRGL